MKTERDHIGGSGTKLSELLREALYELGTNGENWARGDASTGVLPSGKTCILFACMDVTKRHLGLSIIPMVTALKTQMLPPYVGVRSSVPYFNDAKNNGFADVKALFERAISAAEAEGQ